MDKVIAPVMAQSKKQLLLKVLHDIGLLRLIVVSQRNRITILMLHGVTDPAIPATWRPLRPQLTSEQLSKTLIVLSQYYQFVSLSEATKMLAGIRPLVANSLVLTFDDGYRNNLASALPILRRFNAPATIFLSTGNVTEQKPFWFDRLDYAIQAISKDATCQRRIPELVEIDFSSRNTLTRSFLAFIRKERKRYSSNSAMRLDMEDLIERLEQCSGRGLADIFADDPWSGVVTWDEVKQAAAEVDFGSHGVDHPLLALLSPTKAKQELADSRDAIEFHTGRPCRHLAYPDGSFNDTVLSLASECGYSSAVTIIPGLNRKGAELLTLRRIAFPHTQIPAAAIAAVTGLSNQWLKMSRTMHSPDFTRRKEA